MNSDRFRFFSSVLRESDLLVGLSHPSYFKGIESICRKEQERLYSLLSKHITAFPSFATSLLPLKRPTAHDLPPELDCMYNSGFASGTGPMSSVAGLFAEYVGKAIGKGLEQAKPIDISASVDNTDDSPDKGRNTEIITSPEVMVENGGDLYVKNREELVVVVHAGNVALSGKLGLVLPPGEWGVCTSSGTQGHSFSRGKADAVTVVAHSTPLADAWATALANEVEGRQDIEPLLERVAEIPEILACVVIAGGELGIRGAFETKLLT